MRVADNSSLGIVTVLRGAVLAFPITSLSSKNLRKETAPYLVAKRLRNGVVAQTRLYQNWVASNRSQLSAVQAFEDLPTN